MTKKLQKNSSYHFGLAVTKANREAVLIFKCDSHDTEVLALFIYISHIHQKKQECKKRNKSCLEMQYICHRCIRF